MHNEDTQRAPNPVGPDRIDTVSEEAVHMWAERLAVSVDQIKNAVAEVGDRASDVELHLKGSRSSTTDDRIEAAGGDMGTNPPSDREQAGTRESVAEHPATPSAERGAPAAEHGQYGLVREGSTEAQGLTEEQIRGTRPRP